MVFAEEKDQMAKRFTKMHRPKHSQHYLRRFRTHFRIRYVMHNNFEKAYIV